MLQPLLIKALYLIECSQSRSHQARRQDSVTEGGGGGAERNFGGHKKFIYVNLRRARVIYPRLDHTNKVTSKKKKGLH